MNGPASFATIQRSSYPFLVAAFCGILLISNIAATKPFAAFGLVLDGGAFLFPLAYVLGDVLSEIFGFRAARRAIVLGFAMSILASVTFLVVAAVPPLPGWKNDDAFNAVLGFVPRIVAASVFGYLAGQLLNSWVLVRIKERYGEKHLWARLIGSTMVGEFADTALFCTIAFLGVMTPSEFVNYVLVGYLYKTLLEVVLLPVTYLVINRIRRYESKSTQVE